MDRSVALVQAYLQINGYFTVAEYPVLEAMKSGHYQEVTDIDVIGSCEERRESCKARLRPFQT